MSAKVPGCVGPAFSKCEKSSVAWADQIIRKLFICSLRPLSLNTSPNRSGSVRTGCRLAPVSLRSSTAHTRQRSCMGLSIVGRPLTAAIRAKGVLQAVEKAEEKTFPWVQAAKGLLGSSWTMFCFDVPTSVPAFPSPRFCSCGP